MNGWFKWLASTACIAVIVMAALQIRSEIFADTPAASERQQVATPRRVEKCEKAVSGFILRPLAQPYQEGEARGIAMDLVGCDEYGLLDRATKNLVLESPIAEHFKAYQADPNVWRKS